MSDRVNMVLSESHVNECASTLSKSVAYREMTPEQVKALSRLAERRVYAMNEKLHSEGAPQVRFFFFFFSFSTLKSSLDINIHTYHTYRTLFMHCLLATSLVRKWTRKAKCTASTRLYADQQSVRFTYSIGIRHSPRRDAPRCNVWPTAFRAITSINSCSRIRTPVAISPSHWPKRSARPLVLSAPRSSSSRATRCLFCPSRSPRPLRVSIALV